MVITCVVSSHCIGQEVLLRGGLFNGGRLKSFYFFLWFLSLWSLFRVYAKALSCNSFPAMEAAILRSSLDFWSKGFKAPTDTASWSKNLHVVALNHVSSHLCFLMVVLGPFEFLIVNHLQHLWNTSVHNGSMSWRNLFHSLKRCLPSLAVLLHPCIMITHLGGKYFPWFCLFCHDRFLG